MNIRGPLKGICKRAGRFRGARFILLISIPACLPLLMNGQILATRAAGDSPFLLVRLYELVLNLRYGIFPARWMPDGAYGLGYPFFNFYACLPYYLAALFHFLGLGYLWSLKLTQVLGFLFSSASMYLYAKEVLVGKAQALLAAVAFTYAPFHLVNVYTRGDSLSEFYAFAFYPLILWSLERLGRRQRPLDVALVATSFGGLRMTHNISALLFTPWAFLYVLVLLTRYRRNRRKVLALSLAGLFLGLALSSWFWVPALLERKFVQVEGLTSGYFHYSRHFRGRDLVEFSPLFPYRVEEAKSPPFKMGLVQTVLLVGGLVALSWRVYQKKALSPFRAFVLITLAITTYLITPLSRPIWDRLSLLALVQFPWRLLSVQALAASLIIAELLPEARKPRVSQGGLALTSLALVGAAMLGLRPEYLHITDDEVTRENLLLYEYFSTNIGSTVCNEYLPIGVHPRPFIAEPLLERGARVQPLARQGHLAESAFLWRKPTAEEWRLVVDSPQAEVLFPTYYFPGWQGYVDGARMETYPVDGLGYLALKVPQGEHRVLLRLERTPLRAFAEGLSLAAVLCLVGLSASHLANAQTFVTWAIGMGLLLATLRTLPRLVPRPTPTSLPRSDITLDTRVLYPHHNPQGIRFGEAARLLGHHIQQTNLTAGQKVQITLSWQLREENDLTAVLDLVTREDIFHRESRALASDRARIDGPHTKLSLTLPKELNRGIYLLRISLEGPEGRLVPLSDQGWDAGRVYLRPLWVASPPPRKESLVPLGMVVGWLVGVETQQEGPEDLRVLLTWRVQERLMENYKLSVRLVDPSGRVLSSHDAQPDAGSYPTSLWLAGELVYDRHSLPIPAGTPPGGDYALEVVLYRAKGAEALGSLRIPKIALTIPTQVEKPPILVHLTSDLALSSLGELPSRLGQGEKLPVTTYWWAAKRLERNYAVSLWLEGGGGEESSRQDGPLASGYPSSQWPPRALVRGWHEILIGKGALPGKYRLCLALTDPATGERLKRWCAASAVEVVARERHFQIPEMDTRLEAEFGGEIVLLGYELKRREDQLAHTLHWQAQSETQRDYKVFVHLLDLQTEQTATQRDVMPRGGEYPTSQWVKGEVVSDRVELPLAGVQPGKYNLAVGLYEPGTMARLRATGPAGLTISGDRVILEDEIVVD